MFEPMALPKARPGCPCKDAMTETRISGADVAKATIVRPMSSGRHAQVPGGSCCAVYEPVRAPDKGHETGNHYIL